MQIPNRRRIPRNYDVLAAVASVDIRASIAYTPALYAQSGAAHAFHRPQPAHNAWKLRVDFPLEGQITTDPFGQSARSAPQKFITMEPQYPYNCAVVDNPSQHLPIHTIPEPNMAAAPESWESLGRNFTGIANLRRCIAGAKDRKILPMASDFGDFLFGDHAADFAMNEAQKLTLSYLQQLIDYYHIAHGVGIISRPYYVFDPENFYGWLFERSVEMICFPPDGHVDYELIERYRGQALAIINRMAYNRPPFSNYALSEYQ